MKFKQENILALSALIAVVFIAIFIVNIDLVFPSDTAKMAAGSSSFNISYKNNLNASVALEEFSNFQCPYCARASKTVEQVMLAYGDKVNIEFKHMPFNSGSKKAAEASECAREQERFWEYHHVLFDNKRSLGVKSLKKYAEQLNLDTEQFNNCLDSGKKKAIVQQDLEEAVKRGVEGTPTFFVNGNKLVGAQPFEALKALIDIELGNN